MYDLHEFSDLIFMVKKQIMPASKSKNYLFIFAWSQFKHCNFYQVMWSCLFPEEIQSNDELDLVLREKNA